MRIQRFSIPIVVHPSFFGVVLFLSLPRQYDVQALIRVSLWILALIFSILWHEAGHVLVALCFKVKAKIRIYSLGGLACWEGEKQPSPLRRIAISAAGPVAGFVLAGLVLASGYLIPPVPGSLWGLSTSYLLWISGGWGALNLLPLLPLDGGHIFAALLELMGQESEEKVLIRTRIVSLVTAVGSGVYALHHQWIGAGFLIAWAGITNIWELLESRASAADEPLWDCLKDGWTAMRCGEIELSEITINSVLAQAQSVSLRKAAAEQLAWVHLQRGHLGEAQGVLRAKGVSGEDSPLLMGAIALAKGEPKRALPLLLSALRKEPNEATIYYLVESLLELERLDDAWEFVRKSTWRKQVGRPVCANLAGALMKNQRYQEALRALVMAFDKGEKSVDAFNIACCHSRLGASEQAAHWLERALDLGADPRWLTDDFNLEDLRKSEYWSRFSGHTESVRASLDRRA